MEVFQRAHSSYYVLEIFSFHSSLLVTATFLHWLVGMLYVFYFAAFIILLREVFKLFFNAVLNSIISWIIVICNIFD